MKLKQLAIISALGLCSASVSAEENTNGWETIPVASEMDIVDEFGHTKTIKPSCALESITNPADGSQIPNPFQFYFKEGTKPKKLVVFFNGGGACWNDETCVSSLALNSIEGQRSTYNPTIHSANTPVGAGGIFDDTNDGNPFQEWSKVFIPYCTGDIHIGSNTKIYQDIDGTITGQPGAEFPIEHRGHDNFLAVRDWLINKFKADDINIRKVLVTGSSAGGYGASFNFPEVKSAFPRALAALVADGSNGIVSQGFIDSVFVEGGNWNLETTLTPVFSNHLGAYSTDLLATMPTMLAPVYPNDRFGRYTTAWDFVQVQFLKIMSELDAGNTDVLSWKLNENDGAYFAEWNARMEASEDLTAATLDNYQYYIGGGNRHTIMTNKFATEEEPNPFYDEKEDGVKFKRWTRKMLKRYDFEPQNIKYSN